MKSVFTDEKKKNKEYKVEFKLGGSNPYVRKPAGGGKSPIYNKKNP